MGTTCEIKEKIGFDAASHSYSWNGWNPPSVSHILAAQGLNAFDPTWWRNSLLKKGIKAEQASDWVTDLVWDGCDRLEAETYANQFVATPMSLEDAETYMEWRRVSATSRGSRVHARIEHKYSGNESIPGLLENPVMIARDNKWFCSFRDFCLASEISEVIAVEQALVNTVGIFCGTVDFAAEIMIPELGDTAPVRRVIDWKTCHAPTGKVKTQGWMALQMAAYGATLNRLAAVGVTEAINVHLYPGGYQITRYKADVLVKSWQDFLGHLWNYWEERGNLGLEYHSPQMAAMALQRIRVEWGG